MATSFVEQATLELNSKSAEARVKNINRLLRDLNKNAQALKRTLAGLDLSKGLNIGGAAKGLSTLNRSLGATSRSLNNLRKQAAKPITVNTRYSTSGSSARPPLSPRAGAATGAAVGSSYRLTASSVVLHAAAFTLAYSAQRALVNGITQGFRTQDVATTRAGIQGLTPEQRKYLSGAARGVADRSALSYGQSLQIMAESLPSAQGNPRVAAQVAELIVPIIKQQVALGDGFEKATDGAFQFVKAAEQMGRLTDAAGVVDPAKFKNFMALMQQMQATIGREATADFFATLVRNTGSTKYTLDDRGLMILALAGEEERTKAATGLNQLTRQLSGERIQKDRLAYLRELGLFEFEEVAVGTEGGRSRTETKVAGVVDQDLLYADATSWIEKNLVPAMVRQGFDPNNITDIRKFSGKVTSDRSATATLISLLARRDELGKQADRALGLSTDDINKVVDESGLLALQSAKNEFIGALGEASKALLDQLRPAVSLVTLGFNSLATLVGSASPGQIAGAGLAGAGAALYAGKKAIDFLNPLTGSAVALNGSAAALDAAAVALMRAAGVDAAGSLGDGARGGKGKGWAGAGLGALLGLGGVAAAATTVTLGGGGRVDEEANAKAKALYMASNLAADTVNQNLFEKIFSWASTTLAQINASSDEGARTWERSSEMAVSNLADTMIMQAPAWGEAMGQAVQGQIRAAGDELAEKLRSALRTPVQIASGVAAAVVGADTGTMTMD